MVIIRTRGTRAPAGGDPLAGKYAHFTPYQYAGNDPVNQIDIDGLEGDKTQPSQQSGGNASVSSGQLEESMEKALYRGVNYKLDVEIVHNVDGTRIYNVDKEDRSWDYADYNSKTDKYDFKKINSSNISESDYDAIKTIKAVQGEEEYVKNALNILAFGDINVPDSAYHKVAGQAREEYWTKQFAPSANSNPGSIFGVPIKSYNGMVEPNYVLEDIAITIGTMGGASALKAAFRGGIRGIAAIFGKNIEKEGIVALGEWGELRLAKALKGAGMKPNNPFKTSMGNRYIDRLVNGIAHEAKAGKNVKLTSSIRKQVEKDVELVKTGVVDGAHWHFFNGADKELLKFLKQNNIKYTVH